MDQATLFFTIATFLIMALLWWIVSTIGRVRIAARQAAVRSQFIDKLSTQENLLALLSHGDRAMLESVLGDFEEPQPYLRILSCAQAGIVLLILGVALIVSSLAGANLPIVLGVLVTALGLGLASAAAVSYRLSKAWGLLPRHDESVLQRKA